MGEMAAALNISTNLLAKRLAEIGLHLYDRNHKKVETDKENILLMVSHGMGFKVISKILGVQYQTVRSVAKKHFDEIAHVPIVSRVCNGDVQKAVIQFNGDSKKKVSITLTKGKLEMSILD